MVFGRGVKSLKRENIMSIDENIKEVKPLHDFRLTVFPNLTGAKAEILHCSTAELIEKLMVTTADIKAGLPLISACRFGDLRSGKGNLRHNQNVLGINALIGEHDAGVTPIEEAQRLLAAAGIEAILYQTARHTDAAPRWRVLCPLAGEQPPSQHGPLMDRLNGILGGALAGESWTVSQSFYFGFLKDANPVWLLVNGDYLDMRTDLDERAICKPGGTPYRANEAPAREALLAHDPERLQRIVLQTGEHDMREPDWANIFRALTGAFGDRPDLLYPAAEHVTSQWEGGVTSDEEWQAKLEAQNPQFVGERQVLDYCRAHGADLAEIDAYEAAASKARAQDAFEADQDMPPPPVARRKRFAIDRISPLDHSVRQVELIAGWFGLGEFIRLNAAPGTGKTTIACDWACHVAGDLPWRGNAVTPGAVLIVELEGRVNAQTRIEATCTELGLRLDDLPIFIMSDSVSLAVEAEWRELLDGICETDFGAPLRLIIIDTQARASAGADENSASDTALIVRAIDEIRARTGAAVLILHHLPHAAERARGSSAFLGAVDCELIASRDERGFGTIRSVKMRNRADPHPASYRLKSVPIGFGPDGELITGAAAVEADPGAAGRGGKLSGHVGDLYRIITANEPIQDSALRRIFVRQWTGGGKSDAPGRAYRRALQNLKDREAIEDQNGIISIKTVVNQTLNELIGHPVTPGHGAGHGDRADPVTGPVTLRSRNEMVH